MEPEQASDVASALASAPEAGWSERRAAARVRASLFGEEERPLLPRYVLEHAIGRGAMGEVWAAHDPQLDRKVAIKLLLPSAELAAPAIDRMAREARSLARLSHPNVVQVFDLGTYGPSRGARGLFIVMELVRGVPLSTWLMPRRTWQEIVDRFAQAGLGLAAAHDVGMVHRDFKPGNVFVGDDGRVRVGDFGLARLADLTGIARQIEANAHSDVEVAATLAGDLTETGAVIGTPLYMSPEQHAGRPTDARSDQYAFCVALYEALHRRPPFTGTIQAIAEAKHARALPHRAFVGVPEALRAAILQGLEPAPARRWSSMRALVATLRGIQTRRRRTWIAGAAGVGLVAAATALAEPAGDCDGPAVARRHWTPDTRARVQRGLAGTIDARAVDATLVALDGWIDALASAATAACQVDRARATARWDCLGAAASQFDAVAATLADDGPLDAEAITNLRLELPDATTCAAHEGASPIVGELRPIAAGIEAHLAQSRVLLRIGHYQAALALAQSAVDEITAAAEGLESLLPAARFRLGAAYWELLLWPEAEAEFTAGYFEARARNDHEQQVLAACRLASLTASQQRAREAQQWLAHCEAAFTAQAVALRSPSGLALARGIVAFHDSRFDDAIREYRAAIAACDGTACVHAVSTARNNLARLFTTQRDDAAALVAWRDAAEHATQLYGPQSPSALVARAYMADATVATAPGEALDEVDAVLAALRESGRVDPEVQVELLEIRAAALEGLGRLDDALATASEALAIARATPELAGLLSFALGRAAALAKATGDVELAFALFAEALAVIPVGEQQQRMAAYLGRGVLAFEQRRWQLGYADHQQARELAVALGGPEDALVTMIDGNVAEARVQQTEPGKFTPRPP